MVLIRIFVKSMQDVVHTIEPGSRGKDFLIYLIQQYERRFIVFFIGRGKSLSD